MMNVTLLRTFAIAVVVALAPTVAIAQQLSAAELLSNGGVHRNRNYFSPESWEHFDVGSGNLLLTFTDLELPGNAGQTLRLQRVFNATQGTRGGWRFGFAGMVMEVIDPFPTGDVPSWYNFTNIDEVLRTTPTLWMTDGAVRQTAYVHANPTAGDVTTLKMVTTTDFIRFDRSSKTLWMPDGIVAHYRLRATIDGYAHYELADFQDPFGNAVMLEHEAEGLRIRQVLGNNQERVVHYAIDSQGRTTGMSFLGRTWIYNWREVAAGTWSIDTVTLPDSSSWQFGYDAQHYGALTDITLPHGGHVVYEHEDRTIYPTDHLGDPDFAEVVPAVFTRRKAFDRGGQPLGVWNLDFGPANTDRPWTGIGIVTTPSGITASYRNASPGEWAPAGLVGDSEVSLADATGGIEQTTRTYRVLPSAGWGGYSWGAAAVTSQTVRRPFPNNQYRDYTTSYSYRSSDFADYHHPMLVTEQGDAGTRSTYFEYEHKPSPWLPGLPTLERVSASVDSQVFEKRWGYNAQGFRTTETIYGITTTFTPDGLGNLASTAKPGRSATEFSYSWGQVAETRSPEYTITRSVDEQSDRTIISETKGGRTTVTRLDMLGRVTRVQPPGNAPAASTEYDLATHQIVTSRGNSQLTATLDGFGRTVMTATGLNIRQRTVYDAEGRVRSRSVPYKEGETPDVNVEFIYDGLDRIIKQQNPDNTEQILSYAGDLVTVTDENGHATTYRRAAFGDPDDGWLVAVHDAEGNDWSYSYNALGNLQRVNGPNGVVREWVYDSRNLLRRETHPESGAVTYDYDAAGLLQTRSQPDNVDTTYTYDRNDRLKTITANGRTTTITYEPGTDNRASMSVDGTESTFRYDAAGRFARRIDWIDDLSFTTEYDYDSNDNLQQITYPSGLRVAYAYNAENQITRIYDPAAAPDVSYARDFTYYPSGAVTGYVSGNGLPTTIEYDPNRLWTRRITTAGRDLQYGYDYVGNVLTISDGRGANYSQTFTYDALDRLFTAQATGSYFTQYGYDAHGNIQLPTLGYRVDNRFRLATVNSAQVEYDGRGNLTGGPGVTYAYGSRNVMDTVSAGGNVTDFKYDADGWRLKKDVHGGDTSYFVRSATGQLLTEYATGSSGQTEARNYIYAGSRLIAVAKNPATLVASSCHAILSPIDLSTDDAGDVVPVTISVAGGCHWTAAGSEWVTVSPNGGTGAGTVTVDVSPNDSASTRSAQVLIAGAPFLVTQSAVCNGTVDRPAWLFPAQGGTLQLYVTANGFCQWVAKSRAAWATIAAGASGTGDGLVTLVIAPNAAVQARTTVIRIAGQSFTATQAGAPGYIGTNQLAAGDRLYPQQWIATSSSSPYKLFISDNGNLVVTGPDQGPSLNMQTFPGLVSYAEMRANGHLAVLTANPENVRWQSLPPDSPGAGVSIDENGTVTLRAANGTPLAVWSAYHCSFQFTPNPVVFDHRVSYAGVSVSVGDECNWQSPTSSESWLTITDEPVPPGHGAGGFGVSVTENTSSGDRTGTVTIAGRAIPVIQHGVVSANGRDTLTSGMTLGNNEYLLSPGGRFKFGLSSNGQLYFQGPDGRTPWGNNRTPGTATAEFVDDGRLTVFTASGVYYQDFPIAGVGAYVKVYDLGSSGRVVLHRADGGELWSSAWTPCSYQFSPASLDFRPVADGATISVSAGQNCFFDAQSSASWLTVTDVSDGGAGGTVSVLAAVNYGEERTATLTIGNGTVAVVQRGTSHATGSQLTVGERIYPNEAIFSPNQSFRLAMSSNGNLYFSGPDGTSAFNSGVTPGFAYAEITPDGRLATFNGSGVVQWQSIAAGANAYVALYDDGHMALHHAGGGVAWQVQWVAPTCDTWIYPTVRTVGADGDTFNVSVTMDGNCGWQPSASAGWIDLSGANGFSSGTATIGVSPNPSTDTRIAHVTLAGQDITIQQSGITLPSGYVGCFTDDENRALPVFLGTGHTIESCVQAAAQNGYAYAGLQYYEYCFAGNTVGYTEVSSSECGTPCTANSSEMCGGVWRNSIYATGASSGSSPMQSESAVRGCSNWTWLDPVYQPSPDACHAYCASQGADACEWETSTGGCYAEWGSGCYVEPGYSGWSAEVFN